MGEIENGKLYRGVKSLPLCAFVDIGGWTAWFMFRFLERVKASFRGVIRWGILEVYVINADKKPKDFTGTKGFGESLGNF
jgi:hypothetical protein